MKISETLLFVEDLDRGIQFMERTGLVLQNRQDWGWALFLDPMTGQKVGLLLRSAWEEESEHSLPPRLSFESDDLDADVEILREAGATVGDISGDADSTRSCTFIDQDGIAYFLWQSNE